MIDLKLVIQSIKSISPSTMSTGYLGLNSETLKFQVNFPKCKSYICLVLFLILLLRGSGVLPKGQLSWNISLMKEARVDPKIVLELSMECPSRGIFFFPYLFCKNKKTYILQNDTSSSIVGYKPGRAH